MHCLTGCAIGTALGWGNVATITLAVVPLALASDTLLIAVIEIVDNVVMVPGAMEAGLVSPLFWASLAFVAAFPVNRCLIARGKGHAVIHQHHGH